MTREPLPLPGIQGRADERGYALLTVALFILIFGTAISSYSYVFKRNLDYDLNFSAGERLADAAVTAHTFAQAYYFDKFDIDGTATCAAPAPPAAGDCTANGGLLGPWYGCDTVTMTNYCTMTGKRILRAINSPYINTLTQVGKITLGLDVRGIDRAPPFGIEHRAPSAYLHLRIRPPAGQTRRPGDQAAFLAGANAGGLKRVGFVGQHPAGDTCGGQPTVVRWGAEAVDCLNQTWVTGLGFTDVQNGDIIIPAWETALNSSNKDNMAALMRYPQPMRPDKQIMSKNVLMCADDNSNGCEVIERKSVLGIKTLTADVLVADTNANFHNTMLVRQGETANLDGICLDNATPPNRIPCSRMNDGMTVSTVNRTSGTGPAMTVAGVTRFTDSTISVAHTLKRGTGTMRIYSSSPVIVDRIGMIDDVNGDGVANDPQDSTVRPVVPDPLGAPTVESTTHTRLAVDDVSGTIGSITVTNGNLGIQGDMDTSTVTIRPVGTKMDVYAAQITTLKTGTAPTEPGGEILSNKWDIGSVDQVGNTDDKYLKVVEPVQVDAECYGRACPDSITDPPDTPPL